MPNITIANNHYNADPLYQWDLNQMLYIYGVNIAVPILHFSNRDMGSSINRYGDVDDKGVISVKIPNSILQNSNPVEVYICSYEGETFKTHYKILIPVKARPKPGDYTLVADDEEVYSFTALEKMIVDSLRDYDLKYFNKYDEINSRSKETEDKVNGNTKTVNTYVGKFNILSGEFKDLKDHVDTYDKKIAEAKNYVEPWNVDENVGKLCQNDLSKTVKVHAYNSSNTPTTLTVDRMNIIAINSGIIRIGFDYKILFDSLSHISDNTTYIKILLNDEVLDTINFEESDTKSYVGELSVQKDDVITVEISVECLSKISSDFVTVSVDKCNLYANIETPYKYTYLTEDYNAVSTADILNTLLGV